MKSLLSKLIPGVLFCMTVCLGTVWVRAQHTESTSSSTVTAAPVPSPVPQVVYVDQWGRPVAMPAPTPQMASGPAPAQMIVCGNCGAQIAAPQPVLVAIPTGNAPAPGQSFYGIPAGYVAVGGDGCQYDDYRPGVPAQPVFGLSTQWRIPANRIPATSNHGGTWTPVRRF